MKPIHSTNQKTRHSEPVLPSERFWKSYSPQHEFPLSSAVSIALHCFVIGALVVIAIVRGLPRNVQALEPPIMDAVEIQGGGGTGGLGGPGVGPSIPGKGKELVKLNTSQLDKLLKQTQTDTKKSNLKIEPKDNKLEVPNKPDKATNNTLEADAVFSALVNDAKDQVAKAMDVSPKQLASAGLVGGSPGSGGGVGGGKGSGFGTHEGPGGGQSPKGTVLTQQQKREMRWMIHFSGSGQEHLAKLKALSITLAIPSSRPGLFNLVDLSGLTPRYSESNLKQFAHKVKWFNVHQPSLQKLAAVLGLRYTPRYVVIFLPKSVEQEMADLEYNYKKVPEHLIQYTQFEIVRRDDGSFGPVVVEQKLRDGVK